MNIDLSKHYEILELPERGYDVLVLVNTFRSSKTIQFCLDSICTQSFKGSLAILIHDDSSDDDTLEIVNKFRTESKFPVFVMKRLKNAHGTQRMSDKWDYISALPFSYLALCDGDDYWKSPDKIQTQYELMQKNSTVALSYHGFVSEDLEKPETGSKKFDSLDIWPFFPLKIYTSILKPIASCTLFIRKECLDLRNMDLAPKYLIGDLILIYSSLQHGSSLYVPGMRSGYRTNGIWSRRSEENKLQAKIQLVRELAPRLKASIRIYAIFRLGLDVFWLALLRFTSKVTIRNRRSIGK